MKAEYARVIRGEAAINKLDPALVAGIVSVESGWRPFAYNPEPRWRWMWDVSARAPFRQLRPDEILSEVPPLDFPSYSGVSRDAEWWAQQASFGLMQIMGAVAREHGFQGPELLEILEPELNIVYGCRHLGSMRERWPKEEEFVSAYNAGRPTSGNLGYVRKVLASKAQYREVFG